MNRADAALVKATEAVTAQAVLAAQVGAHLAECNRANAEREVRERDDKRERKNWEIALGTRLDRQDKQLFRMVLAALSTVVLMLTSIAGFLIEHYVIH